MDMMSGIAAQGMEMKGEAFAEVYSMTLAKKAMDQAELSAEGLLEMLPETPVPQVDMVPKGEYLDVLA